MSARVNALDVTRFGFESRFKRERRPVLQVSSVPYEAASLVDVLLYHATQTPKRTAFTFIDFAGESSRDHAITTEEFLRRARQVAGLLQTQGKPGDRVMLAYPSGIEYLCAFFGCLFAGMIAVPAYPPSHPRLRTRISAIAHDCGALLGLTSKAAREQFGDESLLSPPLACLRWLRTDCELNGFEHACTMPPTGRDSIAFLQYTSGSTGTPKGVMVTHGNVLSNLRALALHMQFRPEDRHLTWLPPYHDMGMIGALLGSYVAGIPIDFMMPTAFLRKPERWLREISKRRITISGAPSFAYELCVTKVRDDTIAELDLSSWSLAVLGAEPIRTSTLRRFSERFSACGFDSNAFTSCYGLAEATLFVTGRTRGGGARTLEIDRNVYAAEHRVEFAQAGVSTNSVVSCGIAATDHAVFVVDPESLAPRPERQIGEIVVSGPSVTAGYWHRRMETEQRFGVRIDGHYSPFLRTGDLGFLHKGELYVSGRVKDLIVIRGVNLYPHDIESIVDHCHEAIRPGCGIAFSIEAEGGEQLVFAQEIRKSDGEQSESICSSIQKSIVENVDVQPYAIVLIESGSIPKTTSGKLSRKPCKERFVSGELQVLTCWRNPLYRNGDRSRVLTG